MLSDDTPIDSPPATKKPVVTVPNKDSSSTAAQRQGHRRGHVQRLSDVRVLLIEDDALNADVTANRLAMFEDSVTVRPDGHSALESLEFNDVDLVLMDLNMPRMDGFTAARRIRKMAQHRAVPIVALSAMATPDDVERSLNAGMNAHVNKPVAMATLVSVVREWTVDREPQSRPKVIVADDEPLMRSVIIELLSKQDFDVFEAENGQHALALINDHEGAFDLVLFDRSMPGISGAELFARFHRAYPEIKSVSLTGADSDEELAEMEELGLDAVLLKPVTGDELLRTINGLIQPAE